MGDMVSEYRMECEARAAAMREILVMAQLARIADAAEAFALATVSAAPDAQGATSAPGDSSSRVLDTTAAAGMLGVSRGRLYRMVQRGLLPERRIGRRLFFYEADLAPAATAAAPPPTRTGPLASTRTQSGPAPLPPVDWDEGAA